MPDAGKCIEKIAWSPLAAYPPQRNRSGQEGTVDFRSLCRTPIPNPAPDGVDAEADGSNNSDRAGNIEWKMDAEKNARPRHAGSDSHLQCQP